jgi:hypothetical protein
MNDEYFQGLLSDYLAPMLGARLSGKIKSTTQEKLVAHKAPNLIAIKHSTANLHRFILSRDRSFEKEEFKLAEDFLDGVRLISDASDKPYFTELVRALPRWIISRHLQQERILSEILERLDSWSSETYEGRRITCALGLKPDPSGTSVQLSEYWSNSYLISNKAPQDPGHTPTRR